MQAMQIETETARAEVATLSRQLGESPDESYWKGCMETSDRRCRETMEELRRTSSELGQVQLKYQLLKERVLKKAAQVGQRGSASAQPPMAQPEGSIYGSLNTLVVLGALADSTGAAPQRSAAPEGSFTYRPPLSGQRRRRDQQEQQQPQQDEGEGSRQE